MATGSSSDDDDDADSYVRPVQRMEDTVPLVITKNIVIHPAQTTAAIKSTAETNESRKLASDISDVDSTVKPSHKAAPAPQSAAIAINETNDEALVTTSTAVDSGQVV